MARLFKTSVTVEGEISTNNVISSTQSSGDEGGQINLAKAATNTTLTTGVSIDINQNFLRFFETGGNNRGYYLDITGGGNNVGTNLVGTASAVSNTVTGTNSADLVYGNMADSDQFRIRVGGTATNAGFAEIATADDGTEPIYVRQYTGVFATIARTATLLDGSGNTTFPGTVTGTTFSGSGASLTNIPAANVTGTLTSPNVATSLVTSSASFDLINANATTVNFAGAATTFNIGNTATAAQTVNMFTASTGASTYNFATGATNSGVTKTLNIGTSQGTGGTINVNIGGNTAVSTSTINLNASTINSSAATLALFATPTTITMGVAATSLTIGGATSSTVNLGVSSGTTVNIATAGTSTTNIATGATSGNTRTVNIGTTSVSNTSTQVINIAATTVIQGTNTVNIGASATLDTTLLNLYARTTVGSLTLRSGTATANTAPLYFGNTSPVVLTSPVSGAVEYDGIAFYSTPNSTTGRAVVPSSYYYVSDGSYATDFSTTATAKSIFGGAAVGLTLIAGTTYEFELNVYANVTTVGTSALAKSHSFLLTTVSGSPVTTIYQQISIATNTTSFATASTPTTLRNINNATVTVLAATTAGTSRFSIYNVKGIIRVTGTGSVEISPAATSTGVDPDYSFIAAAGSYIFIRPIGNGTVTNVGSAWA